MSYTDAFAPGLIIHHTGEFIPLTKQPLTIGRAADNCLVLADPQVSAYHAVISWQAERSRYLLERLGSTNGTHLNERRVAGPRLLRHGDVIRHRGPLSRLVSTAFRRWHTKREARPVGPSRSCSLSLPASPDKSGSAIRLTTGKRILVCFLNDWTRKPNMV